MELNKGINLGGYLSQCNHMVNHYENFIQEEDIKSISKMGFDHVRLPIDYEVVETEEGKDIESGYQLIERVISWCQKYSLNIIIDLHKAYGYDFNDAGNNEKNNIFTNREIQIRFINLWKKIVSRFGKYNFVAFELLNEVVEETNVIPWNNLIKETVEEIRKINKDCILIYGGIMWNSATTIKYLEKPIDENIIFTFHFYEPILFTHQRAYWIPSIKDIEVINYPDTMTSYKEKASKMGYQGQVLINSKLQGNMGKEFIESIIIEAINAAKKMNVKLYVGEFGVIDQAPVKDTVNWIKDVVEVFKKYDIGYCLWTYKQKDFGLIDEHYKDIKLQMVNILTK